MLRQSMLQQAHANAEPIPGYRLIERLGRGGYGEVWKVEAPGGMFKALKFVFGDMEGAGEDGKAAEQEFRSLNRVKTIRHPFLLSIERIEVIDGQLLIVTELADQNLWERFTECADSGLAGVPRPELIRYIEEAAEALDLMNVHHNIQHLDIKPQNLFLVQRHVKVADFGLAKDLEGAHAKLTGGLTPMYAPPETFEGWVSQQSDQYSLAIVYMEMLTGRRPFDGTTNRQLVLQHMSASPDLAALPAADREAVSRALSKKPESRYRTCVEFVRALKGEAPTASPHTGVPPGGASLDPQADTAALLSATTQRLSSPRTKSLPALVTPKSKVWVTATPSRLQRAAPVTTLPSARRILDERVGEGVLFPALLVGIGGGGLQMLRELRRLIADQFGRPTLPHLRWLFIDTDPGEIERAQAGHQNFPFSSDEVLLTSVRRPTHYLSRDRLPPVDSWLPSEDLFRIPRSPATEGVRKIGRLALCDHYHMICHKARIALEPFFNAAGVEESDRLTRLGLRSTFPSVFIASSLTGGTGSGMVIDFAYLIRREMIGIGIAKPRVQGLLSVPTIGSEKRESRCVANARAAMAELSYYSRPGARFEAVFDTREGLVEDPDPPFQRCTIVPQTPPHQVEIATTHVQAAHIAYTDLLTPIGTLSHPNSAAVQRGTFSVVAMQKVVWPRAHILRAASRMLARRLLSDWTAKSLPGESDVPAAAIEAQWGEPRAARAAFKAALESHLEKVLGGDPEHRVRATMGPLPEHAEDHAFEPHRLRPILQQLVALVGGPGSEDADHAHEIGRILAGRAQKLSAQFDARLSGVIFSLIEQPGLRLAAAEESARHLRMRLEEELALAGREAAVTEEQSVSLFAPIHQNLFAPGSDVRAAKNGRGWHTHLDAHEHIQVWALARLRTLVARAQASIYRALLGNLPERVREINLIRGQLGRFGSQLLDADGVPTPADGICRTIFANGAKSIEEEARRLIKIVDQDQLRQFEHELQARIRHECRGLVGVCARPGELGQAFLALVLDHANRFLDARLAYRSDPILIDLTNGTADEIDDRLTELVTAATPTGLGQGPPTVTILAQPDENASLIEKLGKLCTAHSVRVVPSKGELIVWRECHGLGLNSFPHLSCHLTGEDEATFSAHSRGDVQWSGRASIG